MQSGNDKHGRVISARVPLSDYIELLQEAQEKGLSLSDLLLLKLYKGNTIAGAPNTTSVVAPAGCPIAYNKHLESWVPQVAEFVDIDLNDLDYSFNVDGELYVNINHESGKHLTVKDLVKYLSKLEIQISNQKRIIENFGRLREQYDKDILQLDEQRAKGKIKTVTQLKSLIREFARNTFEEEDGKTWRQEVMPLINELQDIEESEESSK